MERLTLSIDGMSCANCVKHVDHALRELAGVTVEHVAIGQAVVQYDPAAVSADRIADAVADEGYTVAEAR